MNRRNRTLIVVGVAAMLAMVASFGVYRAILRASTPPVTEGRHAVVVAATPLPLGTLLKATDLRVVDWPDTAPVSGTVTTVEALVGRGVIAPLVANEPVTADKLAPEGAGAGLPPAIPAGMRAMAVKVNDVIGVAGFAVPGTHVDVVATMRAEKEKEQVSRVVLSNVQVLTAGTNQEQTRTNDPIRATVVTLLVTPEDAERLALVTNEGTISLALRNPLDLEPTESKGIRLSSLVTPPTAAAAATTRPRSVRPAAAPVPARAAPTPPPSPTPYTVQVIRAAKRVEEIIKK